MIWLQAPFRWIVEALIRLFLPDLPQPAVKRLSGRWWLWITDARARARLYREGMYLVPIIVGGAGAVPGYLRFRVVNPRALNFSDGFENANAQANYTLWHSLGTEAGTDNSIAYWNQTSGVWSYAAHLITSPATNGSLAIGGHRDWTDGEFRVRFQWKTGGIGEAVMHCDGTTANLIRASADGTNLKLFKRIASVDTQIGASAGVVLTNNTFYWLRIFGTGTTYGCAIASDSAGAPGGGLTSITGQTIADAGVQKGYAGLRVGAALALSFGGAFANVCGWIGTTVSTVSPDGWYPVVTTGEPAFCLSSSSPAAGTYSASIEIVGSASGAGYWARGLTQMLAGNNSISCVAKASAGTANVSAGGVTTGNASAAFATISGTGAMAQNPRVQLNYSGAVGVAYFDTLAVNVDPAVAVITDDLPHLHASKWEVRGMQPGNPGAAAVGRFSIPLHPPGSPGYAKAKSIYDRIDYGMRVEAYIGYEADSIPLTSLKFAGIVREITRRYGPYNTFEISGISDLFWLNYSRPFPGEVLYAPNSSPQTLAQLKNYMGTNEAGWVDGPFSSSGVSNNYTAAALPGLTAGSWSIHTDNGIADVENSTGTGAVLLAKTGTRPADALNRVYAEAAGRIFGSGDTSNAGSLGVGLSASNADCATSLVAFAKAHFNSSSGMWDVDVTLSGFGVTASGTVANALTSANEPEGAIPIVIGLLYYQGSVVFNGVAQVVVNGRTVFPGDGITVTPAALPGPFWRTTLYPFLAHKPPATGSCTDTFVSLTQQIRYTNDLQSDSAFKVGTVDAAVYSLPKNSDPGPMFLELWARVASREHTSIRYTPQAYSIGSRTLGTVDATSDPGTDRSAQVQFNELNCNLFSLELSANVDSIASGSAIASGSGTDGGGVAYWRDAATMARYGVIEADMLALSSPTFAEQLRAAQQITSNRLALAGAGAKTAEVLRDSSTADKWRELDHVEVHCPEIGVNHLSATVLDYDFTEGEEKQTIHLDQFSMMENLIPSKRVQQGLFRIAAKFGNR